MIVRPARETDAPALARVYELAEGAIRAAFGLVPVRRDVLVPWWTERMAAASIFVATPAGDVDASCEPIGLVDVLPGELRALYVVPDYWGTGVASALHRRVVPLLGHATLTVMRDNARARRFYEREGWNFDGDIEPLPVGGDKLVPFVRYRR